MEGNRKVRWVIYGRKQKGEIGYLWKETEIRYMVLVGKSEGNKQLEGQRSR
jgi:hypothetical protein